MRLFVCEFITGGGLYREPIPPSLLQEGSMMRDAVLRDFSAIAGIQLITSRDIRLPAPKTCDELVNIAYEDDVWEIWQREIENADTALLIAPESGGALLRLTQMAEQANKKLLGCHSDAVAIFGDKWLTYQHLNQHQIPTPKTYLAQDWLKLNLDEHHHDRWIAKPIDGAGADAIWVACAEDMSSYLSAQTHEYLVQPFLSGISASFCMLARAGQVTLLSANQQYIICEQHQLKLQACELNATLEHQSAFELLAHQIAVSMPDLRGYLGVDVLIQASKNKMHYFVLDINPRLTTSYVGLHQAMQANPAEYLMAITQRNAQLADFSHQRVMVTINQTAVK